MKNPLPTLAALTVLIPFAASAGLLESFEAGVPPIPVVTSGDPPVVDPTPYLSITQSSEAGVTDGTKSMKLEYDNSQKWHWIPMSYGAASYADWHANDIMLVDLHRASLPAGWNLNLVAALNGPMGWTQVDLVNYAWLNADNTETITLAFDYRGKRDTAPLPGAGLPATDDWFQINLMARGGENTGGGLGGRIYLDNIRFVPYVTPPAPPSAAAYTFDTTAENFGKFNATSTDVVHSTAFGGTLASSSPDTSFSFRTARNGVSGNHLVRIQECATVGGTISYDLIAPAGTLAGMGMTTVFQPHGTWSWNQADITIQAAAVQSIGGGNEIARVTIPSTSFGAGFISAPNYNFIIGFNGPANSPTTIHIDNVMFSPNPVDGAKVTFDDSEQNFVAEADSSIVLGGGGLLVTNPPGWKWGTNATFDAGNADAQVAAVHSKLAIAATKGGVLRFKVFQVTLIDRAPSFTGMQVITALNGPWQQQAAWVDQSSFTEGGDPEAVPPVPPSDTPSNFSRTISIPLYPQGSTATDGFVLTQGANSYQFLVGTAIGNDDMSSIQMAFDDFEVVPNADPEIVYAPALPSGSSPFVGRVLTNVQTTGVFSATGLPPGVTIDPVTGLIHGTPTVNGSYNVVFTVTVAGMTDQTEAMVWVVTGATDPTPTDPRITSFNINGNTAVINWTGTGSSPVTVLRSTSLNAGSWTPISTGDTDGTHTDTTAPAGKAFYRISVP